MSILIKHQDMPKEGEKYLLEIRHDGTVYDAIGHMVAAQAVQFESPWHRVETKEDLPKENDTYIVYLRQGTKVETPEWMGGEPLGYVTEMGFNKEQMLWQDGDYAYNAILSFVDTERDFHVTHWMEKPKPPKEDA